MDIVNASFTLHIFQSYGYYNKTTKQYNGMIRDMMIGNTDVTGVSVYMTEERFPAIDFLRRIGTRHDTRFLVKKPSMSYIKNIYVITFTSKVWYAILTVALIFLPLLHYMLNWECTYKNKVKTLFSFVNNWDYR